MALPINVNAEGNPTALSVPLRSEAIIGVSVKIAIMAAENRLCAINMEPTILNWTKLLIGGVFTNQRKTYFLEILPAI
jgi:hypothetical protein